MVRVTVTPEHDTLPDGFEEPIKPNVSEGSRMVPCVRY